MSTGSDVGAVRIRVRAFESAHDDGALVHPLPAVEGQLRSPVRGDADRDGLPLGGSFFTLSGKTSSVAQVSFVVRRKTSAPGAPFLKMTELGLNCATTRLPVVYSLV